MQPIGKIKAFLQKPFFNRYSTLLVLWLLLALVAWLTKYFPGKYNNFLIFKHAFWHALDQLPLYKEYLISYYDTYHYGPLFSLVVLPFAITPLGVGLFTWLFFLAGFLYVAVLKLPLSKKQHLFIYWFCAHELLTALFMSQFNIAVGAMILLTFTCIEKEREGWAAFFIVLGTLVKLYGIVGLAFFFFSRHKMKFVLWGIGWTMILLVLPMILSDSGYVIDQYAVWLQDLAAKNDSNMFATMQNVSLLGMVRKISGCAVYSDAYLILGGLLLFGLPYLRTRQYQYLPFRLTLLASVLLFCVLFSTGSESSGYIIALMGVALWYVAAPWKRTGWDIALMVFAFVLTSMSPSDLFPAYLREHYVYRYALKALPCALVWFKLSYEMCLKNYKTIEAKH